MKCPPDTNNRSDASVNSPASELSTTSIPAPPVTAKNFCSNSNDRESAICSSSNPMVRNVSHFPRLAVTKTSAPQWRANCTAAMPTPPVAACTNTRCPARTPANTDNPYSAVKNTTGTPAASVNDQPRGTRTTNRWSTAASEPARPRIPITASPTANPVTPGPTSTITRRPRRPTAPRPDTFPVPPTHHGNSPRPRPPPPAPARRPIPLGGKAGPPGPRASPRCRRPIATPPPATPTPNPVPPAPTEPHRPHRGAPPIAAHRSRLPIRYRPSRRNRPELSGPDARPAPNAPTPRPPSRPNP